MRKKRNKSSQFKNQSLKALYFQCRKLKFPLVLAFLILLTLGCDEKKDINKVICDSTIIRYDAPADADIYLIGNFNQWKITKPMTYKNNQWQTEVNLQAGNYGYLFYSKKTDENYMDPKNPLTVYKDGVKSSRLIVEDCRYPTLALADFQVDHQGYEIEVRYSGLYDIDLKRSDIYLNGKKTTDFLYKDKKFYIKKSNVPSGKYSYLFKIKDKENLATNSLFVPLWVEDKAFTWKDAIIYQIMTDRFKNGDRSNDAPVPDVHVKANWQGGDYRGIIQKLDDGYFKNLGINTLWVSSPVKNTSKAGKGMGADPRYYSAYHSYWPIATGYQDFNPIIDNPLEEHFGTDADLKELIEHLETTNTY